VYISSMRLGNLVRISGVDSLVMTARVEDIVQQQSCVDKKPLGFATNYLLHFHTSFPIDLAYFQPLFDILCNILRNCSLRLI